MDFIPHGREIVSAFLRLGATSYGGPAIMGVMQAELQERRQWLSKPRFLEGLALVNMLPGATATQLALFLGHARGGWWGALLGGICFVLPAFAIMLALTVASAARSMGSVRSCSASFWSRCIAWVGPRRARCRRR